MASGSESVGRKFAKYNARVREAIASRPKTAAAKRKPFRIRGEKKGGSEAPF